MLLKTITIALVLFNLYAYLLMYLDKQRAKQHKYRISEKRLLITGFLFGSVGILLGMLPPISHKSRKLVFVVLIPFFLLLQVFIVFYIQQLL